MRVADLVVGGEYAAVHVADPAGVYHTITHRPGFGLPVAAGGFLRHGPLVTRVRVGALRVAAVDPVTRSHIQSGLQVVTDGVTSDSHPRYLVCPWTEHAARLRAAGDTHTARHAEIERLCVLLGLAWTASTPPDMDRIDYRLQGLSRADAAAIVERVLGHGPEDVATLLRRLAHYDEGFGLPWTSSGVAADIARAVEQLTPHDHPHLMLRLVPRPHALHATDRHALLEALVAVAEGRGVDAGVESLQTVVESAAGGGMPGRKRLHHALREMSAEAVRALVDVRAVEPDTWEGYVPTWAVTIAGVPVGALRFAPERWGWVADLPLVGAHAQPLTQHLEPSAEHASHIVDLSAHVARSWVLQAVLRDVC